ncbi:MAG: hypothetical protein KUG77_11920 [Nannocystaceae bacterium]|nr:hypothetical protein [Nannocystaceae bacterium]
MSPMTNERLAKSSCRRCSTYQAEMLITKKPPRMNAPSNTWPSRCIELGLKTMAQKSTTSARIAPLCSTSTWPAGVCIHELAMTIHTELNTEPENTIVVAKKCMRRPTRSQPNTSTARNPDSRKNAKIPSAARTEPNTSPTKRE